MENLSTQLLIALLISIGSVMITKARSEKKLEDHKKEDEEKYGKLQAQNLEILEEIRKEMAGINITLAKMESHDSSIKTLFSEMKDLRDRVAKIEGI